MSSHDDSATEERHGPFDLYDYDYQWLDRQSHLDDLQLGSDDGRDQSLTSRLTGGRVDYVDCGRQRGLATTATHLLVGCGCRQYRGCWTRDRFPGLPASVRVVTVLPTGLVRGEIQQHRETWWVTSDRRLVFAGARIHRRRRYVDPVSGGPRDHWYYATRLGAPLPPGLTDVVAYGELALSPTQPPERLWLPQDLQHSPEEHLMGYRDLPSHCLSPTEYRPSRRPLLLRPHVEWNGEVLVQSRYGIQSGDGSWLLPGDHVRIDLQDGRQDRLTTASHHTIIEFRWTIGTVGRRFPPIPTSPT